MFSICFKLARNDDVCLIYSFVIILMQRIEVLSKLFLIRP